MKAHISRILRTSQKYVEKEIYYLKNKFVIDLKVKDENELWSSRYTNKNSNWLPPLENSSVKLRKSVKKVQIHDLKSRNKVSRSRNKNHFLYGSMNEKLVSVTSPNWKTYQDFLR